MFNYLGFIYKYMPLFQVKDLRSCFFHNKLVYIFSCAFEFNRSLYYKWEMSYTVC